MQTLMTVVRHLAEPDPDALQWTPEAVTPTLWLDASVASSFTQISGKLQTWTDQSGHGNSVVQNTTNARPTVTASSLNGHTSVRCGATNFLLKTGVANTQPFTVMIVGTLRAINYYEGFFDLGTSPATPGPQVTTQFASNNDWHMYAGNVTAEVLDHDFTPHSFFAVFNGAASKLYVDGLQYGGLLDAGTQSGVDIRVGGSFDGNYAEVDIAEFIIAPSVLTTDDVAGFSAYASAKWAVPNNSPTPGSPPTITAADPPDGNDDDVYSYTFTATGDAPIVWAVASGAIPAGLTLSSGGVLSGTLTTPGTNTFTVSATNGIGTVTSGSIVMVIGASSPVAPTITTTTLPAGTQGVAYAQTVHATGTAPFGWSISAGSLPTSTAIGSTSGIISGTPSAAGSYSFTARATNGVGSDTQALSITIAAPGARQPVGYWAGTLQMDDLIGGVGGLSLSDLSSRGVSILACSRGGFSSDNPSWLTSEYATVKAALGSVGAGFDLARIDTAGVPTSNGAATSIVTTYLTPLANEIVAAGGDFLCFDTEPYGWPNGGDGGGANSPWSTTYTTSSVMTFYGDAIGDLAVAKGLEIVIYFSSNAWWQGSNQYEIAIQNGSPSTVLADILTVYMVHGMVNAGATVKIMDAAFQHPGIPNVDYNDSFTQAVDHLVELTDNEFGAGVVGNNIMVWPWNNETGGVWSHSSMQNAADEATLAGSGPMWIYDGDLPPGYTNGDKIAWLDDIDAGTS